MVYNTLNYIGQFVTILSVNKTRNRWAQCAHFYFGEMPMKFRPRHLAHAALIAALYAVLTHFQNMLLPGTSSWAIQLRVSEALSVLAFFTPAAPLGLSLGCLIFNLTFSAALPLDFLLGTMATYLSAKAMWLCRKEPFLGLFMPALFNGFLVGAELWFYIGGGFWVNVVYVALGEATVLLTFGAGLYAAMKKRRLNRRLFGI